MNHAASVSLGLLLSLLCSTGHAFVPMSLPYADLPSPVTPTVQFHRAALVPDALRSWQQNGWTVLMDARTGTAHRILGPGMDFGPHPQDAQQAGQRAMDFFRQNAALLGEGVNPNQLFVDVVKEVRGTWYIGLGRAVGGVTVENAQAELRIKDGRIVLIGVDTFPNVRAALIQPTLDAWQAEMTATQLGAAPATVVGAAKLVIVPLDVNGQIVSRPAWRVETRSTDRARPDWARWYLDVDTGMPFARDTLLRTFEGDLDVRIDDRHPAADPIAVPARWTELDEQRFNEVGKIELASDYSGDLQLRNPRAIVRDGTTNNYPIATAAVSLTSTAPSDIMTASTDNTQANLSAYSATTTVYDRAANISVGNPWASGQVPVYTNIDSNCNAYYDGTNNVYFRAGRGCNNTARVTDVVYHEFGHGFHFTSIVTGNYDGSMGEGAADYLAATITDDPVIGLYFRTDGGFVREIETDRVYPDDWSGSVHGNGRIYSGSLWDLRANLIEDHGYWPGVEIADQLFHATLVGSDNMFDAYTEAILAADTDGDLTNGVANGCAIVEHFDSHGLAGEPTVYDDFQVRHTSPGLVPRGQRIPLSVEAFRNGDCGGEDIASVIVNLFDEDGEETGTVYLRNTAGDTWTSRIPALRTDGVLRYTLTVTDGEVTQTLPAGAPTEMYTVYSGDLQEVECQGFEEGWGEWTTEVRYTAAGQLTPDEWEIGAPTGHAGDPIGPFAGEASAGMDLGIAGDADGRYEFNTENALISPEIDVSEYTGLRLQLRRKLAIEAREFDSARLLVNDATVWSPGIDADFVDPSWMFYDLPLEDTDTVTLRFALDADAGVQLGGWNLDEVCIMAIIPEPEDSGIGDSGLEDSGIDDSGMEDSGVEDTAVEDTDEPEDTDTDEPEDTDTDEPEDTDTDAPVDTNDPSLSDEPVPSDAGGGLLGCSVTATGSAAWIFAALLIGWRRRR